MGKTYIRVEGDRKYLYHAVDKGGNTIDFLLYAHRDKTAAQRYIEKSVAQNSAPETATIDNSGANFAAIEAINPDRETPIKIRLSQYLRNLVEQNHRAIKRRTRTMLDFKDFRCVWILLAGIELMHMIAKGQMMCAEPLRWSLINSSISQYKQCFTYRSLSSLYPHRNKSPQGWVRHLATGNIVAQGTNRDRHADGARLSNRKLAARLGMPFMTVQRIWRKHCVRQYRLDTHMAPTDPDFETKATDMIRLYLNPPPDAGADQMVQGASTSTTNTPTGVRRRNSLDPPCIQRVIRRA